MVKFFIGLAFAFMASAITFLIYTPTGSRASVLALVALACASSANAVGHLTAKSGK